MSPECMYVVTVIHGLIAIFSLAVNLLVTHRRTQSTQRKDSSTLRVALAAELAHLRTLCRDNVDALYSGRGALAACKIVSSVYRGNLGRLHTLPADDVPSIVAAYAMSERIDAFAAVHCKGHGSSAFSLAKDSPVADAMVAMYEKGAAAADRALRILDESRLELAPESEALQPTPQLAAA